MGKKKKKGLSNRLAKMSDEERARYLQHRAAIEEEARRRKEQLISTFMKNKMKKEDGFTRLNIAKINEYWHQILRKIAFKKMRSEILELTDWIKRVVDIKNKIIDKLMIEIDESELQYEHNFKSHLAFIDQFLDIHKHSHEHYRLDYEIKSSELFINSMRELNHKKDKSQNEFQYLKTIIYGMDVEHEKSIKIYKNRTGEFLENFNTSFRYEHEIMVNSYIKKMDNIWQEIHRTLNEYLSNTAVKRHHYIELKHLDDRNRKEREDNERKIAKYTETLNSLKSTYETLYEDDEEEFQNMTEQQKNLTQQYTTLKKQLTKNLENDNKKFTKLTIISNQTIDKLKKIKSKGQTILKIVQVCRKYETEEEKTQSWAAQRKKWYSMYNLVEKIAEEQVEVEHAQLTLPEAPQQQQQQQEEEVIQIPKEVIKEEERFIETRVYMTRSADSKKIKEHKRPEETPRSAPKILKTSKDSLEEDMDKIREEFLKFKEEPLKFPDFMEGSEVTEQSIEEIMKSKEHIKSVEDNLISGDESILSSEETMRSVEGYVASRKESVQSKDSVSSQDKSQKESKELIPEKSILFEDDSVLSREGSRLSKTGSIHSTSSEEKSAPIIKETVRSREGSVPSKRTKGESVRFVDDVTISKEQSVITEKVLKHMKTRESKMKLRESKLRIKGEELIAESRKIKKQPKQSKQKKEIPKKTKVDLSDFKGDSLEIKGLLKGDSEKIKDEVKEVKDVEEIKETEGDLKDMKEKTKKVSQENERELEMVKVLKSKRPDAEDAKRLEVSTFFGGNEENILERYNYLNDLSDLWWMHNRVESEILDLKEERKKLIEENKLFKDIIRGILEDAVLEPPPKKPSKVPKPEPLTSLKMAPQLPNTVFLEF